MEKIARTLLSLFLPICLFIVCIPSVDAGDGGFYAGTWGDLSWTFDRGLLTISGEGQMLDFNSSEDDSAWRSCKLGVNSIVVERGVTNISKYAFMGCIQLKSVTIPEGITSIGDGAFYFCPQLESLTLPEGVRSIGEYAFCYNSVLKNISIPLGVDRIGKGAFSTCPVLENVVIPDGVTSIEEKTFSQCSNLSNVTIPSSVASIGEFAFFNCSSLSNVSIPTGVRSIEGSAFIGCSGLTSVIIPESVTTIGESAFWGCSSLASVTIPESVTTIGESAFWGCSSLASVTIPENVTTIGESAFASCRSLTSAKIPDGATSINNTVFAFCNGLSSVTIPKSIEKIGINAFYMCENLTDIYYSGTEKQWNTIDILEGNDPLANATIHFSEIIDYGTWGDNLTWELLSNGSLYINGEGEMKALGSDSAWLAHREEILSVRIGEGVTNIGWFAFRECKKMESLSLPSTLTDFGLYAFNDCISLKKVTIPANVTNIGQYAFIGCSGLSRVVILGNATNISSYAFYNCTSLADIKFPDTLKSIGEFAFGNCTSLASITIPESVTNIFLSAFYGCSGLRSAGPIGSNCNYEFGWTTEIPANAFSYCIGLTSVIIPDSIKNIGASAFYGCNIEFVYYEGTPEQWNSMIGLTANDLANATIIYNVSAPDLNLPASLTAIESEAFAGGAFTFVKLSDKTTSIGSRAFADCPNLRYIFIPAATINIAPDAFAGVDGLTILGTPGSTAESYAAARGYTFIALS